MRPIDIGATDARPELVASSPFGAAWLRIDGAAAESEAAAAERRAGKVAELDTNLARLRRLLADPVFVQRAPADVVARERERLAELEERKRQLLEP